jgi:uncharacterized membrane protein YsdA (DUF1294 family)
VSVAASLRFSEPQTLARDTVEDAFALGQGVAVTEQGWLTAAVAYLGVVAVMSCASFAAYWADKRRAVSGGRRVPERTLHLLAFLGGWPGAMLAQRHFRHKTRKVPFRIVFWAVVVQHVAVVGAVVFAAVGSPR